MWIVDHFLGNTKETRCGALIKTNLEKKMTVGDQSVVLKMRSNQDTSINPLCQELRELQLLL